MIWNGTGSLQFKQYNIAVKASRLISANGFSKKKTFKLLIERYRSLARFVD